MTLSTRLALVALSVGVLLLFQGCNGMTFSNPRYLRMDREAALKVLSTLSPGLTVDESGFNYTTVVTVPGGIPDYIHMQTLSTETVNGIHNLPGVQVPTYQEVSQSVYKHVNFEDITLIGGRAGTFSEPYNYYLVFYVRGRVGGLFNVYLGERPETERDKYISAFLSLCPNVK